MNRGSQAHERIARRTAWIVAALVPALAVRVAAFGTQTILDLAICLATALACEALALRIRGMRGRRCGRDLSWVVTATIIALALPHAADWWFGVVATAFAIAVAQHLYGGLGYNVVNPAMAGYALVIVLAPQAAGSALNVTHAIATEAAAPYEAPMPLALWLAAAYAAGGAVLIAKRIAAWQIPLGMLGTMAATAAILHWQAPQSYAPVLVHLLHGTTLLGAFFVATDTVTGSETPLGRFVFGIGVGMLVYFARTWGGSADGVAFAVIFMNLAAPLIDYCTRPARNLVPDHKT